MHDGESEISKLVGNLGGSKQVDTEYFEQHVLDQS